MECSRAGSTKRHLACLGYTNVYNEYEAKLVLLHQITGLDCMIYIGVQERRLL